MPDELKRELNDRGLTRGEWWEKVVDRQGANSTWSVPAEVELREDEEGRPFVWWDPLRGSTAPEALRKFDRTTGLKSVEDDGSLFSRFLNLGHAGVDEEERRGLRDPELVLAFADRYGIPPICQSHGQPASGCPGRDKRVAEECERGYPRVEQVVVLSTQVRSCLRAAARLRDGEEIEWSDWRRLIDARLTEPPSATEEYREIAHEDMRTALEEDERTGAHLLESFVNYWIGAGGLVPRLEWSEDGPRTIALDVRSPQGAIARHLFLTVTADVGLAVCDGCGRPYVPENRKPKSGQRSWCYDCGKGSNYRIAKRIAARERRAREKED